MALAVFNLYVTIVKGGEYMRHFNASEYIREKYRQIVLKLDKEKDQQVIAKLEEQDSMTAYVRELINEDLKHVKKSERL